TTPTAVITDVPGCPNGVATDTSGNLYVSYYVYPNSGGLQSDVMKYAPGSTKGNALKLSVPGGALLWHPGIDANGDLAVTNIQADDTLAQILVFKNGSKTPTQTIQDGFGWQPIYFAIHGNRLFTGCFEQIPLGNEPAEFAYPSGREQFVMSPKN